MAAVGVLAVLVVAAASEAPLPRPWSRSLFDKPPYRAGVDQGVLYDGQPSLFIDAAFPPPTQVGPGVYIAKFSVISGVQQEIKADRYRGQRMRWYGYLRTEDVGSVWNDDPRSGRGAGLYVIGDSRADTVLYAMTRDGLIGTNSWTRVEMVFDVPTQSLLITIGFFLAGKGRVWAAGFGFEEITSPTEPIDDLDLAREQRYDYTVARHKKRLKQYARSLDAPGFHIRGH